MVENTLVKELLTPEMIASGEKLTRKLDESGVPIPVAMWFFLPEINEWRLIFASPHVFQYGRRETYLKIEEARRALGAELGDLPLSAIGVWDTNDELVQRLRMAVHTGPGLTRVRFSKNTINGHFIDDALIYRIANDDMR